MKRLFIILLTACMLPNIASAQPAARRQQQQQAAQQQAGQLTPWMLQNLTPAGTFFLFAVMCVPYMLIVWKLVPETTGKSLEEIERYWTRSE